MELLWLQPFSILDLIRVHKGIREIGAISLLLLWINTLQHLKLFPCFFTPIYYIETSLSKLKQYFVVYVLLVWSFGKRLLLPEPGDNAFGSLHAKSVVLLLLGVRPAVGSRRRPELGLDRLRGIRPSLRPLQLAVA